MLDWMRDLTMRSLGRWVTTHPLPTLLVCLVSAIGCVVLTTQKLQFLSDRSDLVSPELAWNQRYAEYRHSFPRWDDVIVCFAGDPNDRRIDTLVRELADRLRSQPEVEAADSGFERSGLSPRLFRVADEETFERVLKRLERARALAAAENANQLLALATAQLESGTTEAASGATTGRGESDGGSEGDDDQIDQLTRLLSPYLAALQGQPPRFDWMTRPLGGPDWQPLCSESGRIRFIMVHLGESVSGKVDILVSSLDQLRTRLGTWVAESDVPDVDWGVTGIRAIEADETSQSVRDSTVASILALILITGLLVAVFRGLTLPLIAAASLAVGMAWSFGWLIISVGHLQLLSVVFTVMLLGLGIDFAIHLIARLELVQDEYPDLPSAMSRVMGGVGPGMVTGAVTTAAAFGAVALTNFRGMAEMGVIAGGGVMLCLVAMCTVFPAAIAITGRWKKIIRHRSGGESAHFGWGRLDWVDPHPLAILAVSALVVVGLLLAATRVRYDPNILNLHPPGIESVKWEREIVDDGARSVWAAIIRTTSEEAPALVDRLRRDPLVSEVGGMGMLLPADRQERDRQIEAARRPLPDLEPVPPGFPALRGQISSIRLGLLQRLPTLDSENRQRLEVVADQLTRALTDSSRLSAHEQELRWTSLELAFTQSRDQLRALVGQALSSEPIGADELPPFLRSQWIGQGGSWLLEVFPSADAQGRSVLAPERLGPFVRSIQAIDPSATGGPVQIYESSRLIIREYIKAAGYALAAILIVLLIDFRSVADALCSIMPVGIGFIGVFGVMGLLGSPLNFANIIVLPIILGIGVDAGVHMVHRWRAEPHGRPSGLSGGTGRGITLTVATTMIGFGCMLVAEHRGIRSLGQVMLIGLGMTYVACLTVLPAMLHLRTGVRERNGDESDAADR